MIEKMEYKRGKLNLVLIEVEKYREIYYISTGKLLTIYAMELIELLKQKESFFVNGESFRRIAELLFQSYEIVKAKDEAYELLEIEFYYYTDNHRDLITYKRESTGGEWFFHNSGVDITFRSDDRTYGGILIRSLLDKRNNRVVCGPLNCMDTLFDRFNAFEPTADEVPHLVKKQEKEDIQIYETKRFINYKEDRARNKYGEDFEVFKEYLEKPYRYYRGLDSNWNCERVGMYSAKPTKDWRKKI